MHSLLAVAAALAVGCSGSSDDRRTPGIGTHGPATDQRGQPRGEPCTAGAVEVP